MKSSRPRPGADVLEWIDGAAEAARRARRDPRDADALHRFRVNARRLAVVVKVMEGPCGIPAKPRRRLRRALRATGPWRDGHVAALWLNGYAERTPRDKAARALAEEFARENSPAPVKPRWWRAVAGTLSKIRRAVGTDCLKKKGLGEAASTAAAKARRTMARRLSRLERRRDEPTLHAARIAVKKLRYLMEAAGTAARGLPAPAALRALQTALGEAHDRDVISAQVAVLGRAPALRSAARRALRALTRERSARLSEARRRWKPLLDARRGGPSGR